jgi:hypothetical protein
MPVGYTVHWNFGTSRSSDEAALRSARATDAAYRAHRYHVRNWRAPCKGELAIHNTPYGSVLVRVSRCKCGKCLISMD